jgi:hypothetical protein
VKKITFLPLLWGLTFAGSAKAQTLYVDAIHGRPDASGTQQEPLASLEKAVTLAQEFTGRDPVVIKLSPGLYVLEHQLELRTRQREADTVRYRLEATLLPDDPEWQPSKMPIIQSASADNSTLLGFAHTVGFVVAKNNVQFRGLKFIGNANPGVTYYYPIAREKQSSQGLMVTQCYFIGERNSAPITGAVWFSGTGVSIDHSIFYGCKNALIFGGQSAVSVTHSLIYGAYEAALWYRPAEAGFASFTFDHNVVAQCDYFWVISDKALPKLTFKNSLLTGIGHYIGINTDKGLVEAKETTHTEQGIRKSGTVLLSEVKTHGLPSDYLNLLPQSAGYELQASIFKTTKR